MEHSSSQIIANVLVGAQGVLYYGPTEETMDGLLRGDSFDILTSDYHAAHTILRSGPTIPEPPRCGRKIEIRVADKLVKLNLRCSGDGQFSKSWATSILDERIMDPNGFYRPKEDELYWMMAHRAVAQRAPLNRKLMLELMSTAEDQHILTNADLPTDDTDLELLLTTQLVRRNLLSPRSASILGRAIDMAIPDFRHGYQILAVRIRTLYFAARENILARLPILSSIKRAVIQNGGNGKAK